MRGRKPKPTILKIREGNPGCRPLNDREPIPPAGAPEPPEWLDELAMKEWDRITPVLADMELLTPADHAALEAYCTVYSRWARCEQQVQQTGTIIKALNGRPMKNPYLLVANEAFEMMRKLIIEFGLTPSSRSRIKLGEHAGFDEFDAFLKGG